MHKFLALKFILCVFLLPLSPIVTSATHAETKNNNPQDYKLLKEEVLVNAKVKVERITIEPKSVSAYTKFELQLLEDWDYCSSEFTNQSVSLNDSTLHLGFVTRIKTGLYPCPAIYVEKWGPKFTIPAFKPGVYSISFVQWPECKDTNVWVEDCIPKLAPHLVAEKLIVTETGYSFSPSQTPAYKPFKLTLKTSQFNCTAKFSQTSVSNRNNEVTLAFTVDACWTCKCANIENTLDFIMPPLISGNYSVIVNWTPKCEKNDPYCSLVDPLGKIKIGELSVHVPTRLQKNAVSNPSFINHGLKLDKNGYPRIDGRFK